MTLARRFTGELLGTALLLAAVVGSGIMGERLSGGNAAIALLANTLATGATLVTLVLTFSAVSGAHFNPAVTLADASQGGMRWHDVPVYIVAQFSGAVFGVWAAHLMFAEPVIQVSQHCPRGRRSDVQRIRRHLRAAVRDLGLRAVTDGSRAIRRRALHYRGLLVLGVYVICEPGGDPRAGVHEYLCGHPSRRCSGLCGRPARGRLRRDVSVSLACTLAAQAGS